MVPQVAATAGPLNGGRFPIDGLPFSVGRAATNQLAIQDAALSRRHCVIVQSDRGFLVRDLHSRNGTYVNGLPISERDLRHGDEIQIGHSVLMFLTDAAPAADFAPVLRLDEALLSGALDLDVTGQWPVDRSPGAYEALVRITAAISTVRGLVPLGRPLLALLADIIPATRGAIVFGTRPEDVDRAITWAKDGGETARLTIDRALVAQVVRNASAVLTNRADAALLCAPMRAFEHLLGVIYFEGHAGAFAQEQLHLVDAVAAVAGLAVHSAKQIEWLESENQRLQAESGLSHQMVGRSQKIHQIYDFIVKVAPTTSTVLIRGESGTGKEIVARALHRNSGRTAKPFVAINSAALTDSLLESELFGHEKGAFTGAVMRRQGKLEAANGGTLFLDELGELPLAFQAKLLRVLQEREFERVGGTQAVKVDVRLIAATNKDLEEAVRNGSFRADLYYRLNVVSVTVPPLRERRDDIMPLAKHFAARHAEKCGRTVVGISEEAAAYLIGHEWPGNVRELENANERAVVLGSTAMILPEDLTETILDTRPAGTPSRFHDAVRQTKRDVVLKAFEQASGSHAAAAKILALHPNYLHRLIGALGLKSELKT